MVDYNLTTIVLGTFIIGIGYVGMCLKYRLNELDFKDLKIFDKFLQSTLLGTFSFMITSLFFFEIPQNEQELFSLLLNKPTIFLVQFFSVFTILAYWQTIETSIKRIFKINSYPVKSKKK